MDLDLSKLQRQAGALLAKARTAVVVDVLWQHTDESLVDFDRRTLARRAELPAGSLLFAVQAGRRREPPLPGVHRHVQLPHKLHKLLHPAHRARYVIAKGGRSAGKSRAVATVLVLLAAQYPLRIACFREIQRSIKESVHRALVDRIDELGLSHLFTIYDHAIRSHVGGEFIFEGLHGNVERIKSLEAVDLAYVEQAERVSARSLELLGPTIREPGSWIVCVMNPETPEDPVQAQLVASDRTDVRVEHVNYVDNEWLPEPMLAEAQYTQRVDDDRYRHTWLGEFRRASDAVVYAGKYVVEDFTPQPHWTRYYGLDFGYNDPCAALRVWVGDNTLYVDRELWALKLDIDRLPGALVDVFGDEIKRYPLQCDAARPDSIGYLAKHGFQARSAPKGANSVLDGIAGVRAFARIVVSPGCVRTLAELRAYSYKLDRLTGAPLPEPVDADNHLLDALRYALAPILKRGGPDALIAYFARELARDGKTLPALADRPGVVASPLIAAGSNFGRPEQ